MEAKVRQLLIDSRIAERRWNPKLVNVYSVIAGGLGIISLALIAITALIEKMNLNMITAYLPSLDTMKSQCLLIGITLILLAIIGEAISRLRVPPPTWRVREELTRALGEMALLDLYDTDCWKGKYAVCPVGKWNRRAKCFVVPFLLRSVNATEDKFKGMEKSIAGFAKSLDCSIEQDNTKQLYNFRLILWYGNPYKNIDSVNPFRGGCNG